MKIIGIDPGTTRVGFGIVSYKNNLISHQEHGCLRFDSYLPDDRLAKIFQEATKIFKKVRPDIIAIENIFFAKNKKTALSVSGARGVIVAAARLKKIPIISLNPNEAKQAVGVTKRTGKQGVQKMVKILLKLPQIPQPDDAADALALAICCAYKSKWDNK